MEFNEEIARTIIAKYNLSPTTMRIWKTRGSIPKKYEDESYQQADEIDAAGKIILARIKELSSSGFLNLALICELAGISRFQLYDACRGVGRINKHDIEKVKVEITRARTVITKTFRTDSQSQAGMKKLVSNKSIKHFVILGENKNWAKRITDKMKKEEILDMEDYLKVKDAYIRASIMMSI